MRYHYWYVTPAAHEALRLAFCADRRRSWWPLDDSWSLATLRGRACNYRAGYRQSRSALFRAAGVVARLRRARRNGKIVAFVRTVAEAQ